MIKEGKAPEVLDHHKISSCGALWNISMLKVLHIASLCTAEDTVPCPTMQQVVEFLKDVDAI
jgi:hypothetical protein